MDPGRSEAALFLAGEPFVQGAPLRQPNGIAFDPQGNIVVVNIGNNEVLTFSPDGKLLYVFGNEITILDAATLAPVDVWDLSTPADPVMGRFDQGPSDDSADPQGRVTGLFTMRDTVAHRKVLVVGEIDLAAKTIDTFTLGPAPDSGGLSFTMSPDRQHAVVLRAEIGRHELWTIDMAARALRVSCRARPTRRMPRTRLTATRKYTAPNTGHQRSPVRSIQPSRCSHPADVNGGR